MATHSSVLAWRIPGTAEPGGLPSLGSHRVGHDCNDLAAAAAAVGGTGCFATLIVAVCYKLRQVLPGSDDALLCGTTARAVGAARAAAGHKGGEDRTL